MAFSINVHCHSHTRPELREGQQRPINREYYYIDFHATIDAIKYRVSHLTNTVKDMYKPTEEKKDYYCPRCKAQYTIMEVLDSVSDTDFICKRCKHTLEREELVDGASTGNEKASKLASQMDKFVNMLRLIDAEIVPNNDFETALQLAVPVQRNQETNPKLQSVPMSSSKGPPVGVKGMRNVAAAPLDVTITTSSERTAAEKAAEAQRKIDMAARNQMPEWHEKSTVTGEPTVVTKIDGELPTKQAPSFKDEDEDQKDGVKVDDELTAYYAQMAQERENEAREDADSDDEEGDFEDVGIGGSAIGTPSSSVSAEPNGQRNGSLKRKESESGSSASATAAHTPVPLAAAAADEEAPMAKKVKFESNGNGIEQGEGAEKQVNKNDSDADEEAEFEDAL